MRLYFLILIYILFFAVKSYAVQIDCMTESDLLLNNPANFADTYQLNDVNFTLAARSSLVVGCSGLNDIVVSGITYQILNLNAFDWNKGVSFIAGLLSASAFVAASRMGL